MKRVVFFIIALIATVNTISAQEITIDVQKATAKMCNVIQKEYERKTKRGWKAIETNDNDKLTLTDGQVICGTIMELIPYEYVKIKHDDGKVETYKMNQVTKIYKEARYIYLKDSSVRRGLSKEEKGTSILKGAIINKPRYKGFVDFGYTIRAGNYGRDRIEFATTHGVQINSYLFVGVGTGLTLYHTDNDLISIPIYAAVRGTLPYGRVMPYFDFKIGGTVNEVTGLYLSPTVGCRFAIGNNAKSAVYAGIGYTAQVADYTLYNPIRKEWFNDKRNCGGFNIKVGFDF